MSRLRGSLRYAILVSFLFFTASCKKNSNTTNATDTSYLVVDTLTSIDQLHKSWTEIVYQDSLWIIGTGNWHPYHIEFFKEDEIQYYSETEPFAVNRYLVKSFGSKNGLIEIGVQPDFDTTSYYIRTLRLIDREKSIYQIDEHASCPGCYFVPTKDTVNYKKKKIYEEDSDFEG